LQSWVSSCGFSLGGSGTCEASVARKKKAPCETAFVFAEDVISSYMLMHLTGGAMLWAILVVLLVLWLLGIVSANTFGGFIHVLLALAVAVVLVRVIQGGRTTE
jgi:Family of unknown function (DUF5670)